MKMFGINYYYPKIYKEEILSDKIEAVKQKLFNLYSHYSHLGETVNIEHTESSSSQIASTSGTKNLSTTADDVLEGLYDFIDSAGLL